MRPTLLVLSPFSPAVEPVGGVRNNPDLPAVGPPPQTPSQVRYRAQRAA